MKEKKKKQSKTEGGIEGEDLISKLPDDILVRILSLLTAQESVRCSALSRRWAPLPNLVAMKLNFGEKFKPFRRLHQIELAQLIHRVDQFVDSYRGETLDEFRICLPLDKQNRCQIDKWVKFAMAKKVKKFELDLSGPYSLDWYTQYRFPSRCCTSLTALSLHSMKVSGKQIERVLEYCPFLESLCVHSSDILLSLKVDSPVRLKALDIQVGYLQIFEISAPNLISLKYSTNGTKRMTLRAPQLTEMLVIDGVYSFLVDNFHLFKCHLAQLKTLSVIVFGHRVRAIPQESKWPIEIPMLRNLKELMIIVSPHYDARFICLTSWVEASPLLRRFVVKRRGVLSLAPTLKPREIIEPRPVLHQHLKEFEFVGFIGDEADARLVTYIIEIAINLNKIVIDCRDPMLMETIFVEETPLILEAKDCARKFQTRLSPMVEFVLLP